MTEESAVTVCVRVRPLIAREEKASSENPDPIQHFWKADQKSIHQIEDGNLVKTFSFDRVFTAEESTNQLYQAIAKPLVVSSVEGYNGTIFAYGQTSSGKTFTMMGGGGVKGVIPLAVEEVFTSITNFPKKEFLLRVSYMEIYNETVTDLLVDSWKRKPLEVRETMNKTIFVAELAEELVTTPAQALAWIRKGEGNRHYGKTEMNQRSSRSHTIFRMILESRERSDPSTGESADGAIIVSHLNLVDLAGSERVSQTGAEGARFKEGCNINRSLFTLGQVIKKLTDESQKGFTNYRDSKLTRILQNSLGGNAKTGIICTITSVELENTLSTLQFASTAKKMKNDPHVTEVSDDGALLKRYRNEIVDLKRRLQEVSSETHTTATEKEVLSQILQEKEMLQREQEDRIRNLTQLLVTSSNQVPNIKMPKRRVTWGGGTFALAGRPVCKTGASNISLLENFSVKRKAKNLSDLCEEDDFDSHWGIPEESPEESEMSCSVTVRNYEYRLRSPVSPEWADQTSRNSSSLELEMERQQKEEALTRVEALDAEVNHLKLQIEVQEQQGVLGRSQSEELQLQLLLQAEVQQRQEALEKVDMLELKLADLKQQNQSLCGTNEQTRQGFAETIQLCETLAADKELLVAERDYLKDELQMTVEQKEILERENAAVTEELREKRDLDEFEALEQENDLENEMSSIKKALESSAAQCLELQLKLEEVSKELVKKGQLVEELQRMNGKDLVQEVAKLRRSLDDAEGVSRDTKKEWALLRSHNISLQESNLTLDANHGKMEAEVNGLRFQLENGKLRYRNMQSDLQKELNVAFEENTKLSALLAGKVPKNLTERLELERDVASLNKELSAAREAEQALRDQLDILPGKVDTLTQQLQETEQLKLSLEDRVGEMEQVFEDVQEKLAHSEASRGTEEEISRELQQQVQQLSEELQCVRAEMEVLLSDRSAAVSSSAEEKDRPLTAEGEQLQEHVDAVELTQALQSLHVELQEQKQQNAELVKACEQKNLDFEKQMLTLSAELQSVQKEKEALLQMGGQTSAEELDVLPSAVASLTEERDQLRVDMQENMDIMIEVQEQLREALNKNQKQKELIKQLQTTTPSNAPEAPIGVYSQLEELQSMMKTQLEEMRSVQAERDTLLCVTQSSTKEKEELLIRVKTLSEDRDQLLEILEGLRREKQELQLQLEDRMDMMHCELEQPLSRHTQTVKEEEHLLQIQQLEEHLEKTKEDMNQLKSELQKQVEQAAELSVSYQTAHQEKKQLEEDLLQKTNTASLTQELLKSVEEELLVLKNTKAKMEEQSQEKEDSSNKQIRELAEEAESMKCQRDLLQCDMEEKCQGFEEEKEELLIRVKTLSEDRDQLQKTLEGLRREKQQLQLQMEDRMDMMQCELEQPLSRHTQTVKEEEQLLQIQQLEEHLEKTKEDMNQLKSELQKQVEKAAELSVSYQTAHQEKKQLEEDLLQKTNTASLTQELLKSVEEELLVLKNTKAKMEEQSQEKEDSSNKQIRELAEEAESMKCQRDLLQCDMEEKCQGFEEEKEELLIRVKTLSEDRDQLQETLEGLRREKQQLQLQMEDTTEQLHSQMRGLTEKLKMLEVDRDIQSCTEKEKEEELLIRVKTLSEDRDQLQETLEGLRREKQQLQLQMEDTTEQLHSQMRGLTEKLQMLEADRDTQSCTDKEKEEELLIRVKTLGEDRDQLQETLEGLRREKDRTEKDRMDMISGFQETLRQQETELKERDAWKQQVQQLEQQLTLQQRANANAEAETDAMRKLLSEANESVSTLREQMSRVSPKETMSSRLKASTEQLMETFGKSKKLLDEIDFYNPEMIEYNLGDFLSLSHAFKVSVPESTQIIYEEMREPGKPTIERLLSFAAEVQSRAQNYRKTFEALVRMDVELFEERRLQDVLLCRSQAPNLSIIEQDFSTVWQQRVSHLLDKKQLYIQQSFAEEFCLEVKELDVFTRQLMELMKEPIDFGEVNNLLLREKERRVALVTRCKEVPLQGILSVHTALMEELQQLEAEAVSLLQPEKSKRFTLTQALDGAPPLTVLSLLSDKQQLTLQLQQAERKLHSLSAQNEDLQESQIKVSSRVSNQKEANQLLQTELLDSRALVEEKENTIRCLKSKLRESEVPASVAELDHLKTKLIQTEAKLASTADKHNYEIQRMTSLLSEKNESVRTLKETLRKSLAEGGDSFLEGKELHSRLTNSRGFGVKSSILLEKTKLEEEVKLLHVKISELESSVCSQQEEVSRWKSKALKLKGKAKAEAERPSSPCTPTKRTLPYTADSPLLVSSPKRFLVTPKKSQDLDSPRTRYFGVGHSSELLSRVRPKQFFDNSKLGMDPDAAMQKCSWPTSPEMKDVCKTQ